MSLGFLEFLLHMMRLYSLLKKCSSDLDLLYNVAQCYLKPGLKRLHEWVLTKVIKVIVKKN